MPKTNYKEITELLDSRLIDKLYPSRVALEKFLNSGKKLTVYHGVDPTSSSLHLGHSTNYLLLKKFQELGHKTILLIGDFTAQVGDPTGKLSQRKSLTKKQVLANLKTYKQQLGKILNFTSKTNPTQLVFNSKWLRKLSFEDLIKIAANLTVSQLLKRNMFQKRLKKGHEIYLHEFLYPLMHGYDSVALNTDIEIGGTDQTFNMFVGRDLIKKYKHKEKFVIITPLLINPKTGQKLMSKTEGDYVALDDSPNEMYAKIMALPDEVIIPCFKLCTEISIKEIKEFENTLRQRKVNPREIKAKLAREIVNLYHGPRNSLSAESEFNKVFKEKKTPTNIPTLILKKGEYDILKLLVDSKLVSSRSQAKRLIEQRAIDVDGKTISNWKAKFLIKKPSVFKIGKYKFFQVGLKDN